MKECIEFCKKRECDYIKTELCGTCQTCCCNRKNIIFDGVCFCKSYGTIEFTNVGECPVEIYKNNESCPSAVIAPGCKYTLTANPLYRIAVKCHKCCCDIMLCYEGCVCSQIGCCTENKCHHECHDKCCHHKCHNRCKDKCNYWD